MSAGGTPDHNSETLKRCDVEIGTIESRSFSYGEVIQLILRAARSVDEGCQDIFSEDKNGNPIGVSKEALEHTIQCMSKAMKHETKKFHANGRYDYYVCRSCIEDWKKKGVQAFNQPGKCPFCLSFYKEKRENLWCFRKDLSSLSIKLGCSMSFWPKICRKRSFLVFDIGKDLAKDRKDARNTKFETVKARLQREGLQSFRTAYRGLNVLKNKTIERITLSDQQIEGFFKVLNSEGHYAVILYSNNEQ